MSADKTKADLLDEVAALRADGDRMAAQMRGFDDEANTINACVRALNRIAPDRSQTRTMTPGGGADIGRVLRYLADRYGVALVEVRTEVGDCDRPHLDDATEGQLVQAMRYHR